MKKNYIAQEGKRGRIIIARLKPGQDIVSGVTKILEEKKIKSGFIPVLMGGFKKVKLISMKLGKNIDYPVDVEKEYDEPLEYFGQGTIAQKNGKPSIHVHLTAARQKNRSLTGHLVSGEIVFVTEIVIIEIEGTKMIRKKDPEVFNLPLLNFE